MMGSCRSELRSRVAKPKIAYHVALFFILLVVVPTVYAHTIMPTGQLVVFVDDTFEISVVGNCVVSATVSVDDDTVVGGEGTKQTEKSPVFQMTALKKGQAVITISFVGLGNPYTCIDNDVKTLEVEVKALPDLTVTKRTAFADYALGSSFSWVISVSNLAEGEATFANGQVILRDDIPANGTRYLIQRLLCDKVTFCENFHCSHPNNRLITCTANGGDITIEPRGTLSVTLTVTPSAVGALNNPAAGGICRADPGLVIKEVNEGNNDCAHTVVVTEPSEVPINSGHAGAWFDPGNPGQGKLIDMKSDDEEPDDEELNMFLAWFTYTPNPSDNPNKQQWYSTQGNDSDNPNEQQWYTAQGHYSGNTATLDLFETLGGIFDDPQAVTTTQVGEVTLIFDDCDQGEMFYRFDDGRQGQIPLQRVIPGSDNICEELSGNSTEAVDINAGMDGAWFDPNTSGQGFLIDSHPDPEGGNFIFVSWFTYGDDTASGQRWLTAQGSFEGSIAELDVFETTGGSFDDPQATSTTQVGTMSIDFADCSNALLTYSLTDNGAKGDMAITRVLPGGQALCEELSGAE